MANPRDRIRGESDSEEHYRLIAENASDVIAHVNGDGVITWVSPAVEAAFGAPPSHWIGMSALALVAPGDHSEAEASRSRIIKGGIEVNRVRVLAADGTVHWTEFHSRNFLDAAGNPDGHISIFRVVDDEVALEQARDHARGQQAEAYAQLRAASDAALDPQAIVEVVQDPAGEVVDLVYRDVNRAFCEYVGLTREQQVGHSLLDTFPGVDGAGLLARYTDCAQTGEPVVLDAFPYFNELLGRICYYDIRGTRIRPGLIFLAFRDATDRIAAQQAKAESESRFRRLMETSSVGMCLAMPDGRFDVVNQALCDMLGYDRDTLLTKTWQELTPGRYLVEDLEKTTELLAGRLETYRVTKQYIRGDGELVWGDLSASCIRSANGEVERIVGQIVDITDEVAARAAAEQARRDQVKADALYRRSMESAAVGMCLASPKGPLIEVNQAFCDFFGYDEKTLLRKTWVELTAPEYLQADLDNVADMVAGRIESYRMIKQFIHADGHRIWGDLAVGCLRDANGGVELSIGQIVDITEQVQARQRQAEADAIYRRLMDSSIVATALVSPESRFLKVNKAMCDMLGYDEETLLTKTWPDLTAPDDLQTGYATFADLAAGRIDSARYVKRYIHADGHLIRGEVLLSCIRAAGGAVEYFIAQIIDITEQVEARERQAQADARFRRVMENSNVGMSLTTPDGRFEVVNQAMCEFFGYDADTLRTKTWQDLTPAEYMDADVENVEALIAGRLDNYRVTKQFIHADGHRIWGEVSAGCLRDASGAVQNLIGQIIDITEQVAARERQAEADARFRRVMENSNVGMSLTTPDGRFEVVNAAMCEFFGYDADTLRTKTWQDLTPAEYLDADLQNVEALLAGRLDNYRVTKQFIHADGHRIWAEVSAGCLRDASGAVQSLIGQIVDITEQVEARAKQAEADARFRNLIENSSVGIAMNSLDGRVALANQAMGDLFGFDAETMRTRTWQDQTPAHHLADNRKIVEDLVADRIQRYRDIEQFIHADGHLFWGDISAFCLRNSRGEPEFLVAQIIDVTERVEAERRLKSELEGAAAYVASILPGDLDDAVRVSSRFLPSREVGGDCFDFAWLDEDHLMVYLLDVSGHGAEPAMLAVSARNLMKSGTSFVPDVFRQPDQVLTFMNRFHRMEEHGNHYLTMWYGVYQKSTRTLRYASAGHPPALALSPGGRVTLLSTPSTPVGMFADSDYHSAAYQVSAGDQILVFSDGVFDFPLKGETDWGYDEFVSLCTELAAQPDWSLDTLLAQVRTVSGDGHFDDDCSLVRLTFD